MAACTTETLQTDIDMTEFTISSVKNDTNDFCESSDSDINQSQKEQKEEENTETEPNRTKKRRRSEKQRERTRQYHIKRRKEKRILKAEMRKEALSYKADHGDEGNTEQENEPVSTADVPGPVDISSEDLSIPKDNENLESVDPSNDSSLELTHADNAMQETSTNHIDEMSGILFVFAESSIHSEFNKANLDMNKKEEDYGYEYFSLSEFWK